MPRVFFAVWPDDAVAKTLHALAGEAQKRCQGRVMRRETLHLTLAFLGEVSEARVAEARRVADAVVAAPFDFVLDRLGYWQHSRILWAGGVSPPLTLLAKHLNDGLRAAGFRLDVRPFVAHLTLLRAARCGEVPALTAPVAWPVAEFALVASKLSSQGASYRTIGRWPLAAGDAANGVSGLLVG